MNASSSWEFCKEDQTKILWVHICSEDLTDLAMSINKWWKSRYPEYKMKVVPKNEFEQVIFNKQQNHQ